MKRKNSQIRNLSTLNPPLLNHSRKPIIFSSKFRNTILLTHLFLPDHFRMELGGGGGVRYHDVITLSQKYLLRNEGGGRGVFPNQEYT